MTEELKADLDRLSKAGVNLDKVAAVSRPGGVAAGIYVGFRVHPLLGAAIAGGGLLAKMFTDGFKRAKIESMRQKWFRVLTSMDQNQLDDFASAIEARYPMLLPAVNLLLTAE